MRIHVVLQVDAGTGIDVAGHIVERRAHELRLSNANPSRSIGRISVDVVNTRARLRERATPLPSKEGNRTILKFGPGLVVINTPQP